MRFSKVRTAMVRNGLLSLFVAIMLLPIPARGEASGEMSEADLGRVARECFLRYDAKMRIYSPNNVSRRNETRRVPQVRCSNLGLGVSDSTDR